MDGVLGTGDCLGLFFEPGEAVGGDGGLSELPCVSGVARLVGSERAVGNGGGKGEIDMDDTLAEWIW